MRHKILAAIFATFVLFVGPTQSVHAALPPEKTDSLEQIVAWCARLNPSEKTQFAHFRTAELEVAVVWIKKTDKLSNRRVVIYVLKESGWSLFADIELLKFDTVALDKNKSTLLYKAADGTVEYTTSLDKALPNQSSEVTPKPGAPQ